MAEPNDAIRQLRYRAGERKWVTRLLARLTPAQRARYEEECRTHPRHRNGRLYDDAKAEIAERIMLEDARRGSNAEA